MRTLSLLSALALMATSAQAMPVSLYASPNEASRLIAVAELGSSSIKHSQPVFELPGWNFAAYTGPITGYLYVEDVDASGVPIQGAPLLLEPDYDAESIASIFPDDEISIQPSTTPDFYLVTFQSSVGLYYQDNQGFETVEVVDVVGTVEAETPIAPVATYVPTAPAAAPAQAAPAQAAPAATPAAAPAAAAPAPVVTPRPAPAPVAPATARQSPVLVDTSFTLRGTLESKTSSFYFFSPRHSYQLKDDEGARIAWLELDDAVLARPLSSLIGQEVVIYGDRKTRADGKGAYIEVRSIRIAF